MALVVFEGLRQRSRAGIDFPLPNGCWRCIGCGKILSPRTDWNQCSGCDTRYPEEK